MFCIKKFFLFDIRKMEINHNGNNITITTIDLQVIRMFQTEPGKIITTNVSTTPKEANSQADVGPVITMLTESVGGANQMEENKMAAEGSKMLVEEIMALLAINKVVGGNKLAEAVGATVSYETVLTAQKVQRDAQVIFIIPILLNSTKIYKTRNQLLLAVYFKNAS